jgi:hypothetical protein
MNFGGGKQFFAGGWLALLLLLLNFVPLHSAEAPKLQPSSDAVKKELTKVVETQLAAFRENDYLKAFTFAAAPLRKQFTLESFEEMVRKGYPAIAQSKAVTFGVIMDDGEQAVVHATVENKTGRFTLYQYLMVREGAEWKINGVVEQKPGEKV